MFVLAVRSTKSALFVLQHFCTDLGVPGLEEFVMKGLVFTKHLEHQGPAHVREGVIHDPEANHTHVIIDDLDRVAVVGQLRVDWEIHSL